MLRNALQNVISNTTSLVWLLALCLPVVASAQTPLPPGSAQPQATSRQSTAAPALFVAQGASQNLAERLKAIQQGNATTQNGTAQNTTPQNRTSSRRTANRGTANRGTANRGTNFPVPPAASAAPTAPAPVAPRPAGTLAGEATSSAAPNLPSVLVKRGTSPKPPATITAAPITDAADLTTSETLQPTRDLSDAVTEDPASRTARRRRSSNAQPMPAYQAPAFQSSTTTSTSGPRLSLSEQSPALRIEAIGPKTMAVGKPATYRVRLANQGSVAAKRVVVTATVPGTAQVLSAQSQLGTVNETTDATSSRVITWAIEQVPSGGQQDLVIELKATSNQPIDLKVDWMYRPAALAARIAVQQPQLAVAVDGPVEMRFGETKVFKVKLSNPGNGPAENVSVNIAATGANGQPNRIGTLGAGESRTLELEMTANQAGTMQISAVARGDGSLQAQSAHEVRVRRAVLAVQIAAPQLVYSGTTASYKIRVANRGDAVAEGVIMQVEMPNGAANGIGVDKKPITLEQPRWRIGDLSPGAERVYSMQCDLSVSGQNQLVARVNGTDESSATDTALTMVEAMADLKLVINDPKGPVPVGQDAIYEIKVINRGSKEATNINLVAQFSEGIEPAAATGQRADIVPGQVVFDPIAKIPAGGEVSVKITARADRSGNLRFRAELNCGSPETKLVAEENTRFFGSSVTAPSSRSAQRTSGEPTPARR